MELDLRQRMEEEELALVNKLNAISDKTSEAYKNTLDTYQRVENILGRKVELDLSVQKNELEKRRLQIEQDRIDSAEMIERLKADIEERRIKDQQKGRIFKIIEVIVGGCVVGIMNVGSVIFLMRANNSGETLPSSMMRFINPLRNK